MIDLSIIIPVYNVEKYVAECLQSVMTQTRIEDIAIECLIVDDCGSDNSMQVVDQTIASYKGPIEFKILHHSSNKGLSAARNTGIREAHGEYLTFIDSDDYLLEEAMYNLFKIVRKYPDSEIVQGEIQPSNPNKYWIKWQFNVCAAEQLEYVRYHKNSRATLLNGMPMTAWARLVKRKFITENNLYFVEGMIHEDDMWTLEASQYIQNISFCFTPVYYYRQNVEGSIQTNPERTKSYLSMITILYRAIEIYNLNPSIETFEFIYKKLHFNRKRMYWNCKIDKSMISSKLNELNKRVMTSKVPKLIKFMSWYNTLPTNISFNKVSFFLYNRIDGYCHDQIQKNYTC